MDIKKYLPKDKMDLESVAQLKTLNLDELRQLIPDLFEWLQDINWPVASQISELLMPMENELVPFIKKVLSSNDSQWKYCILSKLVENLTIQNKEGNATSL